MAPGRTGRPPPAACAFAANVRAGRRPWKRPSGSARGAPDSFDAGRRLARARAALALRVSLSLRVAVVASPSYGVYVAFSAYLPAFSRLGSFSA